MKKLLVVLCGLILFCAAAVAQDAATNNPPLNITVGNFKWSKRPRVLLGSDDDKPRLFDFPSPGDRRADMSPTPRVASRETLYSYRADFTNRGDKQIKAVVWEYIFTDPNSEREMDRHRFYSRKKISVGDKETIEESVTAPPSRVISAQSAKEDKDDEDQKRYRGRVEVRCVVYQDDSFRTDATSADQSDCQRFVELLNSKEY